MRLREPKIPRGVSLQDWLNVTSRPYHLTIGDIKNLPSNKPINIFLMGSGAAYSGANLDLGLDSNSSATNQYDHTDCPTKPSVFFRYGRYMTFTKINGQMKGRWIFNINPSHVYVKEFDIEVDGVWKTIKNGTVDGVPITNFAESTRVGWRGPMMLVQSMDMCDDIFWTT